MVSVTSAFQTNSSHMHVDCTSSPLSDASVTIGSDVESVGVEYEQSPTVTSEGSDRQRITQNRSKKEFQRC
jgi:hypothetical protein